MPPVLQCSCQKLLSNIDLENGLPRSNNKVKEVLDPNPITHEFLNLSQDFKFYYASNATTRLFVSGSPQSPMP